MNLKETEEDYKKRYLKMPFKEWDGKAMLYSELLDKHFADEDSIDMTVENNNIKYEDLRLIICDPVKLDPIDPDVIFEDFLPEGQSFSETASLELRMAINDLNDLIADEKQWSWEQGDYRTEYRKKSMSYSDQTKLFYLEQLCLLNKIDIENKNVDLVHWGFILQIKDINTTEAMINLNAQVLDFIRRNIINEELIRNNYKLNKLLSEQGKADAD